MKRIVIYLFIFIAFLAGCKKKKVRQERMCARIDMEEIVSLLPKSSDAIENLTDQAIGQIKSVLSEIELIDKNERTYLNTVLPYEQAYFIFHMRSQILRSLAVLSSDASLQLAANLSLQELNQFKNEYLARNEKIYYAFQEYLEYGKDPYHQTKSIQNFLEVMKERFVDDGINLDSAKKVELMNLSTDITRLSGQFYGNILHDIRHIVVQDTQLEGIDPEIIKTVHTDGRGSYILPSDMNIFFNVMENCHSDSVRKDYYDMFGQIAYPQNESVLKKLIQKQYEYAQMLGYQNFAEYQTHNLMFKQVKKVEHFLWSIVKQLQQQSKKDYQKMLRTLPAGVQVTADGKLNPWDEAYVKSQYRKKVFHVNDREIARYFPLDFVLPALLKQLEKLFFVTFELDQADNLWADNVISYRVRSMKNQAILGYLFLDLYQRPGKKITDPCSMSLIPAIRDDCSIACVGASIVATQFNAVENEATLLEFSDVIALFHEMGHALHDIFGATRFTMFSGTQVQQDFLEVPSMMLEYLFDEPKIIEAITHHYQTGKTLSGNQINQLIAAQKFGRSDRLLKQIYLSLLSLELYKTNGNIDIAKLSARLYKKIFQFVEFDSNYHIEATLHHLAGNYASVYYTYPLSAIIGADLFKTIKENGFLNNQISDKYVTDILSPGGSVKPQILLKKFLGRSFNQQAYFSML
jgi:thimet oligopeptidase